MIRVENVHKTFVLHQQHGVRLPVLADASLTVNAGECVVLHGHSGSGKSTLLRSLYANYLPDSGHIHIRHGDEWVDLVTATPRKVLEVRKTTIGWVSQFLRVIPRISALEVVMQPLLDLGTPREASAAKAAQLLTRLNVPERLWHLAPSTFSGGEQQRVNIARGFAVDYPILLLDEPTASLTPGETERLFSQIRALQALDVGIVFISHKLPEIRQLASHVSVMRDGAVVLSGETAGYGDQQLISAMTPASRDHALSDTQKLWLALPGNRRTQAQDFPVLRVEDLTGEGFIDLSLEIRAGEIVGLAGLVGSGRTEFAETLYGLRPPRAGRIWLENREISQESTRARLASGLVYLPEDRQVSGLFLDAPVRWNTVMFNQPSWWQQGKREAAVVERYHRALGIKLADGDQPVRTLSGGNQQKVLLARCLEANPLLLIVDEPTRGDAFPQLIDIGAGGDIHAARRLIDNQQ